MAKEASREDLATGLTIVEVAVQSMADAGLDPLARATALAIHLRQQVALGAGSQQAAEAILKHLSSFPR